MKIPDGMVYIYKPDKLTINLESKELVFCKNCIWYDPPHIDKDGVRYEYKDMPPEAFDALGTGLVNLSFGINVGGKCLRDCNRGYSEDKSVFREENDFCSKAERGEE